MTDLPFRPFADDAAIHRIGEGLLACTLPKAEWTHEAHLAACLWIIVERPDIEPERDLREIISRYNESVGGVNDDFHGYHHTITMTFVAGVRSFLMRMTRGRSLVDKVNTLLASPQGRRDWPLAGYSRDRLFSVEARRTFVAPDLAAADDEVRQA